MASAGHGPMASPKTKAEKRRRRIEGKVERRTVSASFRLDLAESFRAL